MRCRSAFSETLGRRTIYLLSFSLFVVFSVLSAVSVNMTMLIVMRILSGGSAASVQDIGAGTVADIWEPKKRGRAMGICYVGPLCGPGISPIIGGALTQALSWRSTLWALVVFGGVLCLLIIFCLPETLTRRKPADSEPPKDTTGPTGKTGRFVKCFIDPFKVLALLRHPPIVISGFTAAISFGSLYVLNISTEVNFGSAPYNYDTLVVGLLYLAPTLGYAVASVLGGRWIDYIMHREAVKAGRYDAGGKLVYWPEDRMKENIWLAAILYPAGLIWYGWTIDRGILWIVPEIAAFFFGIGSMLVFGAVTTMLTEFTPKKSSSGVAVNNFIRNIIACAGAIVTEPLVKALGAGWTCTLFGLFAFFTGIAALFAIKKRGPTWRKAMDKMLNTQE